MSLTVIHPSLRDVSAPDDLHIQNLTRSVFHLQGIQKERIHHLSDIDCVTKRVETIALAQIRRKSH